MWLYALSTNSVRSGFVSVRRIFKCALQQVVTLRGLMALHSRENTFKVDLSNLPRRPSYEEIHNFINQTLGIAPSQVKRLQVNHSLKCVHVKCVELATAENVVKKHDGRHDLEVEGCKYRIRLAIDKGYTEVKVHDLSESITNEDIATFLHRYGDVHDVKELSWGSNFAYQQISSGVRVAVMTLHTHIRSFVTIKGQESLITYCNQPLSCRHCAQPQHPGRKCAQNKKEAKPMSNTPITNRTTPENKPSTKEPKPTKSVSFDFTSAASSSTIKIKPTKG